MAKLLRRRLSRKRILERQKCSGRCRLVERTARALTMMKLLHSTHKSSTTSHGLRSEQGKSLFNDPSYARPYTKWPTRKICPSMDTMHLFEQVQHFMLSSIASGTTRSDKAVGPDSVDVRSMALSILLATMPQLSRPQRPQIRFWCSTRTIE
jgi:hypothetical protein